ncbi:MAG: MerR family transcriptional regulator [Clostridiales bacterium]|nr:MerR family transcriptional regulator [Clostridiales bacterium]
MNEDKNYYLIGKVSTLCNVPIKTLRYYDKIGLLVPKYRKDNNYRYYTQEQLLTLFMIRKLRLLGIPIKDIKQIVDSGDPADMGAILRERLKAISHDIETLSNQYASGQMLLDRLAKSNHLLNKEHDSAWSTERIQLETIPVTNVMFTRRVKQDYKNSDISVDRWFELFQMVTKQKLVMTGSVILTYHNNPLEQFFKNECDLEVSIQVNELKRHAQFKTFGGFLAVTALHIGRNEEIIQTHVKAIKWLEKEGYEIAGPISEEYIVSPIDIANEDSQVTKIIIPVKKKGE